MREVAQSDARPVGRPTEYRPEFGEQLVELMATGLSLSASAASLGFHRQRAYEWAEKHPEFADNITHARGRRLLKLEQDLLDSGLPGPAITARIFALKNADAEEWRDKVVSEHTGKDGAPLIPPTDVEVARRVAFLLAKATHTVEDDG